VQAMTAFARSVALGVAMLAGSAQAGIIFTPHLSEYSKLPPGQYSEFMFVYTDIEDVYNREGKRVHAGAPFVPPGQSIQATLALMKFLWIGNVFRDTDLPVLNDHPQFCRVIGGLGWQQASRDVLERSRKFGLTSGGSGLVDLFGLCGIYGDEYRWGPVKANGLFATTVKFPIGRWDRQALLNTGTHYWSYIPQLALHAELWGRFFIDGTVSYQFNEDNDEPAYGGLTPTRVADWRTQEINLAFKWTEHWFTDVGFSHRESVGRNYYDEVTVNFKDPVPAEEACSNTNSLGVELVDAATCASTNQFYLQPRDRPYADNGIYGDAVTVGAYYIYCTSSVINLRMFYPLAGRGSQIDVDFDVCASEPCGPGNNIRGGPLTTTLNGVQEAAAISASPYFEARFVYLFWAP
jgi:hypothetical protein